MYSSKLPTILINRLCVLPGIPCDNRVVLVRNEYPVAEEALCLAFSTVHCIAVHRIAAQYSTVPTTGRTILSHLSRIIDCRISQSTILLRIHPRIHKLLSFHRKSHGWSRLPHPTCPPESQRQWLHSSHGRFEMCLNIQFHSLPRLLQCVQIEKHLSPNSGY